MQLYKMTSDIKKLHDMDDLDPDTLADTLDGMLVEFEEKGIAIMALSANWQADINAVSSEIERLTNIKKSMTAKTDKLKDYLRFNMEHSGVSKISSELFTASLRKPSDIVSIVDMDMLPDEFVSIKTSIQADKVAIKKALKEGVDVPGAKLEKGKSSLLLK
tara:strand:- start:317 stop:799 length:483 start_codon:yes stop_codon:yes gene_type:complete